MKGFRFFTVNNGHVTPGILIQGIDVVDRYIPALTLGKHDLIRHVPIKISEAQEQQLAKDRTLLIDQGNAVLTNHDSNAIVLTATEGPVSEEKVVVLFQGNIVVLSGDDPEGRMTPFPGEIISHTNTELLAVIPQNHWFKASYSRATPQGNLTHYFKYVGSRLFSLTYEQKSDFQILFEAEAQAIRQLAYS